MQEESGKWRESEKVTDVGGEGEKGGGEKIFVSPMGERWMRS